MAMVAGRVARSTLPLALCLAMVRLTMRGLMRGRLPGVRLAGTSQPIVPAGSGRAGEDAGGEDGLVAGGVQAAVKKFRILDVGFTQEDGRLSARLGIKRSVLAGEFAGEIDALYA